MSMYGRRRVTFRWRGAVLTALLVVVLAGPVAAVATGLLAAAHAADPRIPDLGWVACYLLVLLVWTVSQVDTAKVTMDE